MGQNSVVWVWNVCAFGYLSCMLLWKGKLGRASRGNIFNEDKMNEQDPLTCTKVSWQILFAVSIHFLWGNHCCLLMATMSSHSFSDMVNASKLFCIVLLCLKLPRVLYKVFVIIRERWRTFQLHSMYSQWLWVWSELYRTEQPIHITGITLAQFVFHVIHSEV